MQCPVWSSFWTLSLLLLSHGRLWLFSSFLTFLFLNQTLVFEIVISLPFLLGLVKTRWRLENLFVKHWEGRCVIHESWVCQRCIGTRSYSPHVFLPVSIKLVNSLARWSWPGTVLLSRVVRKRVHWPQVQISWLLNSMVSIVYWIGHQSTKYIARRALGLTVVSLGVSSSLCHTEFSKLIYRFQPNFLGDIVHFILLFQVILVGNYLIHRGNLVIVLNRGSVKTNVNFGSSFIALEISRWIHLHPLSHLS